MNKIVDMLTIDNTRKILKEYIIDGIRINCIPLFAYFMLMKGSSVITIQLSKRKED
jgi:hypothetical protein